MWKMLADIKVEKESIQEIRTWRFQTLVEWV